MQTRGGGGVHPGMQIREKIVSAIIIQNTVMAEEKLVFFYVTWNVAQ